MKKLRTPLLLSILFLSLISGVIAQERAIRYPKPPSARLKEVAEAVGDTKTQQVPFDRLSAAAGYYARIAQRQHVLNPDGSLTPTAALGGKPFVFVTTPEGLYGRNLLEIYTDIGYEAEDILRWQLGADMVAIVFRYPDRVTPSEVRDGKLPADWDGKVYVPTWENIFALFGKLAEKPEPCRPDSPPARLAFKSEAERAFVVNFPEEGKRRVRCVPYRGLEAAGGADWAYRRLLEEKLSVFEHFRGNGRTQNELTDARGTHPERGLFEYVGPNMPLKDIPELAIIHLGRLSAEDAYDPRPAYRVPAAPPAAGPERPAPACCLPER